MRHAGINNQSLVQKKTCWYPRKYYSLNNLLLASDHYLAFPSELWVKDWHIFASLSLLFIFR